MPLLDLNIDELRNQLAMAYDILGKLPCVDQMEGLMVALREADLFMEID